MAQNLLFVSMHIFVWLQISLGSIFLRKCWVPLLFYKTYKKNIIKYTNWNYPLSTFCSWLNQQVKKEMK